MTDTSAVPRSSMTRWATLFFAVAGGTAVGNLYWAQPLLDTIAGSFGVTSDAAGLLITATQVGYAIGVFFLVPLGDIVNRKRVIPALMVLSAIFLAATAVAPGFSILLVTLALLGVSTVSGQFLMPLAGDLASDDQRGRVLGTIASGLILGILVARTISGIVADLLGWRAIYVGAAGLMLLLAIGMARFLPSLEPRAAVGYKALLTSVLRTVADSARVRVTILIGASVMSVFTLFWTGLTFLLASPPYAYSTSQIGLVSLVGIVGAVAAQQVGRLFDRGLSLPAIGVGLVVTLLSLGISGVGANAIVVVLISIVLFSVGVQAVQVLIQTRMLSIDPGARSRLNTIFVVANFIGGAIGSAVAGALWPLGGWPALMIAAAVLIGLALLVWLSQRTRHLAD